MQPPANTDYKKLLTEVIQKQMVILGPSITLAKARNVKGLTVADDGTVVNIEGQPQALIQGLIDQFVKPWNRFYQCTRELRKLLPPRQFPHYQLASRRNRQQKGQIANGFTKIINNYN
jgi:hypothetical protein